MTNFASARHVFKPLPYARRSICQLHVLYRHTHRSYHPSVSLPRRLRCASCRKMLLLLFVIALAILGVTVYVLARRLKHGGLAGGLATIPPPPRSNLSTGAVFTAEQVAKHNTQDDLWLIINNKVYNFTEYLPLHPGGEAILRNAGRDSTPGFSGPQHEPRVWDMVSCRISLCTYSPDLTPSRFLHIA